MNPRLISRTISRLSICACLLLGSFMTLQAQYSPEPLDTLDFEKHSKYEIRDALLKLDPSTESYQLADESKTYNIVSIVMYSTGALMVVQGLVGLAVENNQPSDPNLSLTSSLNQTQAGIATGLGGGLLIGGIISGSISKKRLESAFERRNRR